MNGEFLQNPSKKGKNAAKNSHWGGFRSALRGHLWCSGGQRGFQNYLGRFDLLQYVHTNTRKENISHWSVQIYFFNFINIYFFSIFAKENVVRKGSASARLTQSDIPLTKPVFLLILLPKFPQLYKQQRTTYPQSVRP